MFADALLARELFATLTTTVFVRDHSVSPGLWLHQVVAPRAQSRLKVIPGKEALSSVNEHLQRDYGVSVTPTAMVEAMKTDDIPDEMKELIEEISLFASSKQD
jgi:hypothetical protein